MTTVETPRTIAAPVTASGTLVAGKHTPVDATSAAVTMTLPSTATPGAHLSVEKTDTSSNAVTVSGTIRGTATSTVLTLKGSSVTFVAENTGNSWTPTAGRMPEASITAAAKHANRVALFGDSILHLNAIRDDSGNPVTTGSSGSYWGGSMVQHAATLLGQRFTVTDDFAVPGDTTTQMVARLSTVLASSADVVIFMGGTNDIGGSTSASTIIANYQAIYNAILATGKTLVHCTILPCAGFTTTAQQTARAAANRWILQQTNTRPGLVVVPWDADMTDPATGYPATLMTSDGTHPIMLGGLRLGAALAGPLKSLFPDPANGWLPTSNTDPYNALPNGLMLGSNTQTGTNVSGVAPDYLSLSGNAYTAVAGAKIARTDGKPGAWWEMSFTGLQAPSGGDDTGNGGVYWGLAAPFLGAGGYVAASTKTFATFELFTTNFANASGFYIELIYISAGNFVGVTWAYRPNSFGGDTGWQDFAGVVNLPLVNTPAGTDTVVIGVHASAKNGQTVKVTLGRSAVYFV